MAEEPPQKKPAIRTMKTDVDELLGKERASFNDLFAKQTEVKFQPQYRPLPKKRKRWFIVVIAIFIITVVAAVGAFFYLQSQKNTGENDPIQLPRAFINPWKTEHLMIKTGDRTGLILALETAMKSELPSGSFLYLPVTFFDIGEKERVATPQEFFSLLRIQPPQSLYSYLAGDWNMYVNGGDFVFVFKLKEGSASRAKGTLTNVWEKSMIDDLAVFYKQDIDPGPHSFHDDIYKNIDIRVARLSNTNDTAVSYSTVLGSFIVITTSEASLKAMVDRLIAGPVVL